MYTATIGIVLGASRTGLTLSAQLKDTAGTNVGGAVSAGFVELGGGNYQWTYASFPDGFRGSVVFSAASVVQAAAAVNPEDYATGMSATDLAQLRFRLSLDGTQATPATSAGTILAIKAKTDLIGAVSGTAGADPQVVIGDALTAQQFAYRAVSFGFIGLPSTDWLAFAFTVKADSDLDTDAEALLGVLVRNPGNVADGLLVHNRGAAADKTWASLAVTATTPNTTLDLVLKPDAMALAPSPSGKPYRWEVARWTTSRGKEIVGGGDFTVNRSVRRAVLYP